MSRSRGSVNKQLFKINRLILSFLIFLSISTLVTGCSQKVYFKVNPPRNEVLTFTKMKITNPYILFLDKELLHISRNIRGTKCSAWSYNIISDNSISDSIRETLGLIFEDIKMAKRPSITNQYENNYVEIKLNKFDPIIAFYSGKVQADCNVILDVVFSFNQRKEMFSISGHSLPVVKYPGYCGYAPEVLKVACNNAFEDAAINLYNKVLSILNKKAKLKLSPSILRAENENAEK